MSAFKRMADRYEEVEAENGQLHMQVRKLKAEVEELVDAWTREVEELEREVRLMRQQYDRRVEERDELLAALEQVKTIANKRDGNPNLPGAGWSSCVAIWKVCLKAIAKAKGGE